MRWNPFRRAAEVPAADSIFESTVVEDFPPGLASAEMAPPGPGEATSRAAGNIGHVGRYALKSVLGEGGLGTVYAAWDPLLSRAVAVKTLHLQADADRLGELDDLILNEARAAARLSHPHIVTIHDAGPSEQGIYIAMEPLHGRDLRHLLREGWRPGAVEVAHLARRVADALAYAHGKGVIHCDIKPANIFMVGRKQPKVLDFGIARVTHRDTPAIEGPLAGSPYYLAPEQLRGDAVDRRSDVYSLGVVMFELLTGERPYTGRTMAEIARAVQAAPQPQVRRLNPRVPAGLAAIVAQAMARAPADRHPSARNLALDLRHWLDSPEAHAMGEPRAARSRWPMVTVVAAALLATGLTAWWQGTGTTGPSSPPVMTADTTPPAAVPMNGPNEPAPVQTAPPTAGMSPGQTPSEATAAAPALESGPDGDAFAASPLAQAPADTRPRQPLPPPSGATPGARKARPPAAKVSSPPQATTAAPAATGTLRLAISPWGEVSVDGRPVGTTPPLNQLQLPVGRHTITLSNGDLPDVTRVVELRADESITLRHRFGP
jgi:eukaryotic-like serine/threonine-protein kinase